MVQSFNDSASLSLRLIDEIQLENVERKCRESLKMVDAFVSTGRSRVPAMVYRSRVVLNLVKDCQNTRMF